MRTEKLGKKIAAVAVALAATVMMAAPTSVLAVTTPNKGCPANAANGYHNYVYKCTGTCVGQRTSRHTYKKQTCTKTQDVYNCEEVCDLCGLSLGIRYVLHGHEIYHSNSDCKTGDSLCSGEGSYVTWLRLM